MSKFDHDWKKFFKKNTLEWKVTILLCFQITLRKVMLLLD